MARISSIEWTEVTWNPVTGCTKISAGCKNCYAERIAKRLHAMGSARYKNKFKVTLHWDLVDLPRAWKSPRVVFVNSMSDLFHPKVPLEFIRAVFETMAATPHITYQILTKRSDRLRKVAGALKWTPNIWMGVSIEDKRVIHRLNDLKYVPASVRFLSLEPLIGPLDNLDLEGIDWVIVGGESGPKARPMKKEWVESIHAQCEAAGTEFFFKQWAESASTKPAASCMDELTITCRSSAQGNLLRRSCRYPFHNIDSRERALLEERLAGVK